MQAPPTQPAMSFPLDNRALVRSALSVMTLVVLMLLPSVVLLVSRMNTSKSLVLPALGIVVFTSFGVLMLWRSFKNYGSQVEIRDGRVHVIDRHGKAGKGGPLNEVKELKAIQPISQDQPVCYIIVWDRKNRVVFDKGVDNYQTLMSVLENRTGRQFVLQRS